MNITVTLGSNIFVCVISFFFIKKKSGNLNINLTGLGIETNSLFNLILIHKLMIWFNLKHDSIWFYIDYIWIYMWFRDSTSVLLKEKISLNYTLKKFVKCGTIRMKIFFHIDFFYRCYTCTLNLALYCNLLMYIMWIMAENFQYNLFSFFFFSFFFSVHDVNKHLNFTLLYNWKKYYNNFF